MAILRIGNFGENRLAPSQRESKIESCIDPKGAQRAFAPPPITALGRGDIPEPLKNTSIFLGFGC